eukprot:2845762-Rhodomonas_salina.2
MDHEEGGERRKTRRNAGAKGNSLDRLAAGSAALVTSHVETLVEPRVETLVACLAFKSRVKTLDKSDAMT